MTLNLRRANTELFVFKKNTVNALFVMVFLSSCTFICTLKPEIHNNVKITSENLYTFVLLCYLYLCNLTLNVLIRECYKLPSGVDLGTFSTLQKPSESNFCRKRTFNNACRIFAWNFRRCLNTQNTPLVMALPINKDCQYNAWILRSSKTRMLSTLQYRAVATGGGISVYIPSQNQSLKVILCTNFSRWRQAVSI